MRRNSTLSSLAAAAIMIGMAHAGDDVLVVDERDPRDRQPERRPPPEPKAPRELTAADHERLRLAAEKRARKANRQAKGLANLQGKVG